MMPVVVKNEGARAFAVGGLNGWVVDDFSTVVSRRTNLCLWLILPAATLFSSRCDRSLTTAQASQAADVLREDGTFIILSKPLLPAAPTSGQASSPTKPAPEISDLSAANTPERTKPAEDTATDASQEAAPREEVHEAAAPAFDPTFGQVCCTAALLRPPLLRIAVVLCRAFAARFADAVFGAGGGSREARR